MYMNIYNYVHLHLLMYTYTAILGGDDKVASTKGAGSALALLNKKNSTSNNSSRSNNTSSGNNSGSGGSSSINGGGMNHNSNPDYYYEKKRTATVNDDALKGAGTLSATAGLSKEVRIWHICSRISMSCLYIGIPL